MRLLQIDDLDLLSLNLASLPLVTSESVSMEFVSRRREGDLGSMFLAAAPNAAQWVVVFKPNDHASRDALMTAIVGDMTGERRLTAERLDANRTRVVADAVVTSIQEINELDLMVAFEGGDSVWRDEAETATSKTFDSAVDLAMRVAVPGNATAYPVLRITPQTQRASSSVYAGWTWRRRYRIQNNSDVPWFRHPVRIALGSTSAIVSGGKGQADGDDVRVWLHGIEQPRTLVTWNATNSYVWVLVPNLPEGEYLDVDIVYGNPSATTPPVLAYPDIPAFDPAASTNASLVWRSDPDTLGREGQGLFYLSSPQSPATADYGTPGSWRRVITLQDEDEPDQSGVSHSSFRPAAGASLWANFRIVRTAPDVAIFAQHQWLMNGYDGMAFAWPLPVVAITATVALADAASANQDACIVLLCRESSADDWVIQQQATGAGLTAVSDNFFQPIRHVAIALWPFPAEQLTNMADREIADNDFATATLTSDITLEIDDADLSITQIGSEEEIYELAGETRVGGGAVRQAPYHALLLGNARQETGVGTPRLAVTLGNTLEVNCETHEHAEYDATGALVERASAHAVSGVEAWDLGGAAQEAGAAAWLPLSPGKTVVPNGAFAAGIQGWVAVAADTVVATAHSWDNTTAVGEALGAYTVNVQAGPGSPSNVVRVQSSKAFPVGTRATVALAATVRTDNANLTPRLAVRFYDAADALVAASQEADWTPVANTPARRAHAAAAPANAATYRLGLWVSADVAGAGAIGNVWFDDITLNDADVIYQDGSIGAVAVEVGVKGAWLQ